MHSIREEISHKRKKFGRCQVSVQGRLPGRGEARPDLKGRKLYLRER
jgi:hypothetical protein